MKYKTVSLVQKRGVSPNSELDRIIELQNKKEDIMNCSYRNRDIYLKEASAAVRAQGVASPTQLPR